MTLTLKNRTHQVLALGCILAVCVILFLKVSYDRARSAYLDQQVTMLSAIADIHAREITILLDSYIEKVGLVASRTRLRELLAGFAVEPDAETPAEMAKILRDAMAGDADFGGIVIYDLDGEIVTHTSAEQPDYAISRAALADGRFARPLVQSRFDGDSLRLDAFVPLALDGRPLGVLQAQLTPRAIGRMIGGTAFGETGEVVLGLRNPAGATRLLARRGEVNDPTLTQQPLEGLGTRLAMESALGQGKRVLIDDTIDRDGQPVVAVTRYIEATGWGLVAKIDIDEIEGALLEIRNDLVLAACLFFVPGFVISLYLGRQLDRARSRLREEERRATLERADRRFKTVFTHSPVAMLMVDGDGRIEFANHEAENLLEYEAGGLAGRPVDELVPEAYRQAHAGRRDRFNQTSRDHGHYTMAANRDLTAQTRRGNLIPVTIGLTPIATENGPMVVAAISDLTERKAAHERIQAHADALERSNEELDRFAYVASHDLKAPLQGIAQLANMIEEDVGDELPAESREDLALMQKRVQRLKNLLDSLLQYSRIGRGESESEFVDTGKLLAELTDLLPPGGEFSLERVDDLPLVFAPRPALELVFRNLIGNAVKHHDRDRGHIEITAEETADGVVVEVGDDGPGIPIEYGERIFELFQTLKRRDEIEGSGMGLALVKKTLHNLGGTIELLPGGGRGATFRLVFPAPEPVPERKSA